MVWIIDELKDFIDSLPTWKKWLGASAGGVLLFFLSLLIFAGPDATKQVASIPNEIQQVESNITQTYIEESKGPVREIIGEFWRTGKEQAKEVSDPASAKAIQYSWFLAGVLIVAVIVIVPLMAIRKAFKRILP